MLLKLITGAIILARLSNAKYLSDPNEAHQKSYDFVIVGGGTAGAVLASRLSETSATVLLIEAGQKTAGPPESIPFDAPTLTPSKGPWDWNYTTTPQAGLNGRSVTYPRGRVLGGCSAVNFMIFNPGGRDDYDRYAKVAKNDRWSWNSVLPYRKKLEGFRIPDNRTQESRFVPDDHGYDGPLTTTLPVWPTEIDQKIYTATQEVPGFPWTRDMNGGDEIGIGYAYTSIGSENGAPANRTTSASAYLFPFVESRKNLDVLVDVQVTKVLQTGTSPSGVPIFKRVEISRSPEDTSRTVYANFEVILSAGAIGTPQILMLSGIGDADDLTKVGVKPLVNLTDVGRNLQDHPLLPYQWYVDSTSTFEANNDPEVAQEWLNMYYKLGTGPLVNTLATQIGWLRIPKDSPVWQGQPDPSGGPTSGHYELFFSNGFLGPIQDKPTSGNFFSIMTNLVTPASRGSLKLQSNSPWDYPLIDPGFFSDPLDLRMLREAFKATLRFVAAPVFKDYIIKPYLPDPVSTDAEIDAYIRKWTSTVWHPVSTATMSPDGSSSGVVDSKLLVKKVAGLRVVDASVLPWVPAAHPESSIYTIAEVASDLIKKQYHLRDDKAEKADSTTPHTQAYEHVEL